MYEFYNDMKFNCTHIANKVIIMKIN